MKIVSLDFESGGTTPGVNAPVQIGCALMEGMEVLDTFESLISPPRHWKDATKITRAYDVVALQISGITWPKILAAPTARQVCTNLNAWVNGIDGSALPVVAFNSPFDHSFYSDLLFLGGDWHPTIRGQYEAHPPMFLGPWHDARLLAWDLVEKRDLDTVAAHFGLSRDSQYHGALPDAILAGQIFHLATQKKVSA